MVSNLCQNHPNSHSYWPVTTNVNLQIFKTAIKHSKPINFLLQKDDLLKIEGTLLNARQ